jgi:RNA polymerase sigma factor (sigma-70 family)
METAELVRSAADGDQQSWDVLVERFTGLLWGVARAHRLSANDAADVVQTTWLRLVEHLDRINEPERLPSWLATTARRESWRTMRRNRTLVLVDDEVEFDAREPPAATPEDSVMASARDEVLWGALQTLPPKCQQLLRLLAADPPASYEQVSVILDMPIGSIGPTRARCLERLRRSSTLAEVASVAGGCHL